MAGLCRLTAASLAPLALAMSGASPATAQKFPPDFSLKSCLADTTSCAKLCVKDAATCAQTFNADLRKVDFAKDPNWHRFPIVNVGGPRFNTSTPMHGEQVEVFLNKRAFDSVNRFIADTRKGDLTLLDRVRMGDGSIIFKRNIVIEPDNSVSNWPTVMIKLKGYCKVNEFSTEGPCEGGEWFWFLHRGAFLKFEGVAAQGKPQAFCISCHNPTQRSDYSFLLDGIRVSLGAKTKTRKTVKLKPSKPDFCDDATPNSFFPGDVGVDPTTLPPDKRQAMFDCLSWRSFIALNWPAAVSRDKKKLIRGEPDKSAKIGTRLDRPRVWETFKEVFEVFQPRDPDWNIDKQTFQDPQPRPAACRPQPGFRKVLRMNSKFRGVTQVLNETHQAFGNQFNTLVDQKKNILRYEVRFNKDEFVYIRKNKLANTGNYGPGGPFDLSRGVNRDRYFDVRFPAGTLNPSNGNGTAGATEMKGAWKVLCKPDKSRPGGLDCFAPAGMTDQQYLARLKKRYYTQVGDFFEANEKEGVCTPGFVFGLVGLHIAHKTFWAPQWVWSTFEHIDNVPPAGSKGDGKTRYTLFSPKAAANQPSAAECRSQRPGVFPPPDCTGLTPAQTAQLKKCKAALFKAGIRPIRSGKGKNCPNLQLIANAKPHPSCLPLLKSGQCKKPDLPVINQITRIDKIGLGGKAVALNKTFRAALEGTPFANYVLVNTQWPARATVPGKPGEVYTRICDKDNRVTTDCFRIAPFSPLTKRSVRLRNTTMETFQTTFAPLDGNNDPLAQKSSVGCMQCHNLTGVDASFAWVDAAEEIVPISQQ